MYERKERMLISPEFQIISILAIFKTILTNEMIIITFIIPTFIVKRIISIICLDKNIKVI